VLPSNLKDVPEFNGEKSEISEKEEDAVLNLVISDRPENNNRVFSKKEED